MILLQPLCRFLLIAIPTLALLQTACARRPADQVAWGQDENMYPKSNLIGTDLTLLDRETPFPFGEFSRQGFDRHKPVTINVSDANEMQAKLIDRANLSEAEQVTFVLGKNYIYLGIPGESFFHTMYAVTGHYNYRPQRNADGERSQYWEKAQEGSWYERSHIEINTADTDPLKVRPSPTLVNVHSIPTIHNTYFQLGQTIPGVNEQSYNLLKGYYGLNPDETIKTRLLVGPVQKMVLYRVKKDENSNERLQELANYSVSFGNLDYQRNEITHRPQSAELTFKTGTANDFTAYDSVQISPNNNPLVLDEGQFLKSDFSGCLTLAQIPNADLARSIANHLGDTVDDFCFETVFTKNLAIIYWVDQDGNREILLNLPVTHVTPIFLGQQVPNTGAGSAWDAQTHVSLSTKSPSFPVSKSQLAEYALNRDHLEGKEFIYSAAVIESSVDDPLTGAGEQPYWERSKIKFVLDDNEDFVTVYKVEDPRDPTNEDLPLFKFPVSERFDLTDEAPDGEKLGYWEKQTLRPWQKRQYLTIDFSNNVITNLSDELLGISQYLGYYISQYSELVPEPLAKGNDNPYIFADPESGFLSFVTRESLTVNPRYTRNLQPVTVKMRHGFIPLPAYEATDPGKYQPMEIDFYDHYAFGIFYTAKYELDPDHQDNIDNYTLYAQKFNIANGKTITYYLNEEFPDDMVPVAVEAVAAWNRAFEKATGREDVLILNSTDRKVIGDLRYNLLVLFDKKMGNGLAGFGPSITHPDTGEVLSASSYQYAHAIRSTRLYAKYAFEYYVEGKTPEEILEDSYPGEIENELRSFSHTESFDPILRPDIIADGDTIDRLPQSSLMADLFQLKGLHPYLDIDRLQLNDPTEKESMRQATIQTFIETLKASKKGNSIYGNDDLHRKALTAALHQTGFDFSKADWERIKKTPAKLGGLAPDPYEELFQSHNHKKKTLAVRKGLFGTCSYGTDLANNASTTTFKYLQLKYKDKIIDPDKMAEEKAKFMAEVGQRYFYDVLVHEMGHNFGLWHNFRGSVDHQNYPEAYHVYKEQDDEESDLQARMLRTSSVMDYNQRFEGQFYKIKQPDGKTESFVGPYDEAAILYSYGQKLEQVDNQISADVPNYRRVIGTIDRSAYKAEIQRLWDQGQRSDLVKDAKANLSIRPYGFCTNGDEYYDSLCNTFDSGTNPQEIVAESIENYEESYKFNSFSRGRLNFDPYSPNYFLRSTLSSRKFLEDYDWASNILDIYGMEYLDLVEEIVGSKIADLQAATDLAFAFMRQVFYTPDYGDRTHLIINEGGSAEVLPLDIPIGPGKKQYSSYLAEQQQIQFYTQRGILFEKAYAMIVMLSRTRSVRQNFGLSGYEGSSFFGNRRYRDEVIRLAGELFSDQIISDPIGFQSPQAPGESFKFDPQGDRQFRLLVDVHPIVKAAAKVYAALYVDTPGVTSDYAQLNTLRSSADLEFGSAPKNRTISFDDPEIPGIAWEVVIPKGGSSLMAGPASAAQYFIGQLDVVRTTNTQLDSWVMPFNLIAAAYLSDDRVNLQAADLDLFPVFGSKDGIIASLEAIKTDKLGLNPLEYIYAGANLSLYVANTITSAVQGQEGFEEMTKRINGAIEVLIGVFNNPQSSMTELAAAVQTFNTFLAEDPLVSPELQAAIEPNVFVGLLRSQEFTDGLLLMVDDIETTLASFDDADRELAAIFLQPADLAQMRSYLGFAKTDFANQVLGGPLPAFLSYNIGFQILFDTLLATNGSTDPERQRLFNLFFDYYLGNQSSPTPYLDIEQHIGMMSTLRQEVHFNPLFNDLVSPELKDSYLFLINFSIKLASRSELQMTLESDLQRQLLNSRYYLGQLRSMNELGAILSPVSELEIN